MTVPFWCLLVVVLVPYVLAGVGGYYRTQQFGQADNNAPRQQSAKLEGAGARAYAAQQNSWEALLVFGLAVIVAHTAGADPRSAAIASIVFVVARILHAIFYIADRAPVRSASFLVGLVCCLWLFGLAARG